MKTILSHRLRAREAVYLRLFYRSLFILLLALFVSYAAEARIGIDSGSVKVIVLDSGNNEAIPFANVVAYQNGIQVAVGTTNIDGECMLKNLATGKCDIKAVYVGYQAMEIKKIEVLAERTSFFTIKLNGGEVMTTYCVTYCCGGCYFYDNTENWWPKLWTPYREAYAAWKEKRKAKQPKQKEIKLSEEPDAVVTVDSIAPTRIIQAEQIAEQIKIFPNPCSDILHIESLQPLQPLQNLILRDEGGKTVREEMMQSSVTDIKLSGFANGIYYLNYVLNGKSESKIIVVTQ